jgi:DNA-binding response OmpR family regulator
LHSARSRRRALVVDPDPLSGKLLSALLVDAGYEPELVSPGQAIAAASEREVHLVVVEVDLHGASGFQLCTELRSRSYRGGLIFVSEQHDPATVVQAFEAGGDDFVARPFNPHELIARMHAISRRTDRADQIAMGRVVKVGETELSTGDLTLRVASRPPVLLTPTEMRLLECLMRNASITISRDTLIDRAWPNSFIADTNRVDVYVRRLRRKLEPDASHPQYLHTVRGMGYVFRPPAASRVIELHGTNKSVRDWQQADRL